MAVSAVKREAVGLYEQLAAAEARKEELQVIQYLIVSSFRGFQNPDYLYRRRRGREALHNRRGRDCLRR